VFDSGAPSAKAERVVFRCLRRAGPAGAQTIVIAGHHDQPTRPEGWGVLAELVHVHAVGRPRRADAGGRTSVLIVSRRELYRTHLILKRA